MKHLCKKKFSFIHKIYNSNKKIQLPQKILQNFLGFFVLFQKTLANPRQEDEKIMHS